MLGIRKIDGWRRFDVSDRNVAALPPSCWPVPRSRSKRRPRHRRRPISPRSRSRPPTSATTSTCSKARAGTSPSPSAGRRHHGGRRVRAAARQDQGGGREVSNQPIKYLINTHFHGDHTGGNEPFAKDGVTIVAEDQRQEPAGGRHHQRPHRRQDAAGAGSRAALADLQRCRLTPKRQGRMAASCAHPRNAHTDGDTYAQYPLDANALGRLATR